MRLMQRKNDTRVFAALAFVHSNRVGKLQDSKIFPRPGNGSILEVDFNTLRQLPGNSAYIPIEHIQIIPVSRANDAVPKAKFPCSSLDRLTVSIQSLLEEFIQCICTERPLPCRRQYLHIVMGGIAKGGQPFRNNGQ